MAKQKLIQKTSHSPTLNSVLMVEDVLRKARQVVKVAELKKKLPKKIMHSTLMTILDYLQMSGKILISTKGIIWIYTPRKELNKMIESGLEL
ncbi:MAG: hypothetical protein KJ592_03275 [Nanoarchaeota archaeon]|nr:hypothetical protein [Nanoarchaeota archaeon]